MTQRRFKRPKPEKQVANPSRSGAAGGPATAHGMKYQIDYAVLQSLDLISMELSAPHRPGAIWMEPRVIDSATMWDLGTDPPITYTEAKLNPTRQEILSWLRQVEQTANSDPNARFQIVFSRGGGQTVITLQHLIRNAVESRGDLDRFTTQLGAEGRGVDDEILAILGPNRCAILARTKVVHIPEHLLALNLGVFARLLAGQSGGDRLIQFLFHRFAEGISTRFRFSVRELISDSIGQGIQLYACPQVSCEDLDPVVSAVFMILQSCQSGLPLSVLADAASSTAPDIQGKLAPYVGATVTIEDGIVSIRPLPTFFTRPDRADFLARALGYLLSFIEHRKDELPGKTQVRNAIALAEACAGTRPQVAATVFRILDKLLKDIGDKHLVLNVAELSIKAARESKSRTRDVAEGEAHALICGRSWVYQRTGRLVLARAAADESLQCGVDIRWDRNTAYCKKCIGRLLRLEAEQASSDAAKGQLILASIEHIREAIEGFSGMSEFGQTHPEVGDCYSLLGRTLLFAGRLTEVDQSVRKAYELISDHNSKDFLDLLLLDGDLQAAKGDRHSANGCYNEALDLNVQPNPETSEMRARAHLSRGLNQAAIGERASAAHDFGCAATIWQELGELESSARAEWNAILLTKDVSIELRRRLAREPFWVGVEVIKAHRQQVTAHPHAGSARRAQPATAYWEELIRRTKERFRIEVPTW